MARARVEETIQEGPIRVTWEIDLEGTESAEVLVKTAKNELDKWKKKMLKSGGE